MREAPDILMKEIYILYIICIAKCFILLYNSAANGYVGGYNYHSKSTDASYSHWSE